MGHGADGTVPQGACAIGRQARAGRGEAAGGRAPGTAAARAATTRAGAALLGALLAVLPGGGPAAAAPATLTVHASSRAAPTVLHLEPGFATVLRADRRIDTVAIGDPRLVTATAVRRGQDVYDLVLQPQAEGGSTNMVVWLGEIATVWELVIGPGPRTADLVYVVTSGAASPRPPAPPAAPSRPSPAPASGGAAPSSPPARSERPGGEPRPPQGPPAPPPPAAAGAVVPESPAAGTRGPDGGQAPGAAGPPLLEVRQTVGGVVGVFQALRTADGVVIRYRITNGAGADLVIRPGGVLVKVNGRLVPYGMARDSADRGRPEILPRGATETGVIDAPGSGAREVRLILSLAPAVPDTQGPGAALPMTFEPIFSGIDRLAPSGRVP